MKSEKIKKLVLKQETISSLGADSMNKLLGGSGYMQCSGIDPCASGYQACNSGTCTVSLLGSGTGYGMCCCGATNYCTP